MKYRILRKETINGLGHTIETQYLAQYRYLWPFWKVLVWRVADETDWDHGVIVPDWVLSEHTCRAQIIQDRDRRRKLSDREEFSTIEF